MSPASRIVELKLAVAKRLERLRQHWWICELWACTVCIACIVALALLFWYYDGSRQPNWPLGMTVSSVSAILSIVFEFHLGSLLLSSMLRQLKMLWYTRIRPMKDIKRFDDAVNGPIGVVRLIWRQKAKGFASLVGFLMILHYLIGFFVQQAVVVKIANTDAGTSSIPRIMRFDQYTLGQVQQLPTIDLSIQSAIYNGLYNEDVSIFKVPYNCSTGSCHWPLYSSLAVGSVCENLDGDIHTKCSNDTGTSECLYSLPDGGPSVDGIEATLNSTGYLNGSFFPEYAQQLVSFQVIASPGIRNATVSAIVCALYLKVNEYFSAVTQGSLKERIVSSYHNSTPLAHGQPDWLIYTPSSNGEPFSMSGMSVFAEANYLWQLFTGTETGTIEQPAYSADVMQVIATSLRSGNLASTIANVATMVSNAKRASGYSPSLNVSMTGLSPNAAFGTASSVQNVTKIRWPWIVLPGVLSMISVLLLIPMIWKMRMGGIERVEPHSLPWMEAAPDDKSRESLRIEHGSDSLTQTAEGANYRISDGRFTYFN